MSTTPSPVEQMVEGMHPRSAEDRLSLRKLLGVVYAINRFHPEHLERLVDVMVDEWFQARHRATATRRRATPSKHIARARALGLTIHQGGAR
jgi:hypothetical protein